MYISPRGYAETKHERTYIHGGKIQEKRHIVSKLPLGTPSITHKTSYYFHNAHTLVSMGSDRNLFSGHSSCRGTKCEKLITVVFPVRRVLGGVEVCGASPPLPPAAARNASIHRSFCIAKKSARGIGESRETVTKSCRGTKEREKEGETSIRVHF